MDVEDLIKDHLGVDKNIEIIQLAGDASTRCYYRVDNNGQSLIACWSEMPEGEETFRNFLGLQEIFKSHMVPVPEVLSFDIEKGIIIQQDLGGNSLNDLLLSDGPRKKYLEQAIDNLIMIHKIPVSQYQDKAFTKLKFDRAKFTFELNMTIEFFVEKYLGLSDRGTWSKSFEPLFERILDEDKMVLVHRDYHSKNIMVYEDKQFIIDFQEARLGYPQYDLSSFLEDCYYKFPSEIKEEMISYYQKKMDIEKKNFRKDYDFSAVQRILKALGTFTMMKYKRGKDNYLPYIPYAVDNLKSICEKHKELNGLSRLLEELKIES
ncbi:MAG: phosphotransferase [Bdellovibrionales bacterium]|nr:phosphotransferase [Bdellovibrionales bacterium]